MKQFNATDAYHRQEALQHLGEHGFAVIESILAADELREIRQAVEEMLALERKTPFDPGDGPATQDDAEMEAYLADVYKVSKSELARVAKRIRHARAQNHGTPWPVNASQVNHSFMHIPLLLDDDKSQRSYNLPAKLPQCARLIQDPFLLPLLSAMLKEDFILSDISATSVGPHTAGGYWHVDAPLTMLPEPLPDVVLAVQTAWMLDDFTPENGATRVLPGSHRTLKKPEWSYEPMEGEITLTAPAGSLALWLSHTWHRVGANVTDQPRRAIIGYFSQAWVKPFTDYTRSVPRDVIQQYSPEARYRLGWSAFAPQRG
jgi:hypothetical protein